MTNIQEAPYTLDAGKDSQETIDKQLGSLIGETVCDQCERQDCTWFEEAF